MFLTVIKGPKDLDSRLSVVLEKATELGWTQVLDPEEQQDRTLCVFADYDNTSPNGHKDMPEPTYGCPDEVIAGWMKEFFVENRYNTDQSEPDDL